jgi:hypothetical protein
LRNEAAAAAGHADLCGRDADPGHDALSAAASAAAAAACDDDLSGRHDGTGRRDLPNSASAPAASAARRRARLSLRGNSPVTDVSCSGSSSGLPAARTRA